MIQSSYGLLNEFKQLLTDNNIDGAVVIIHSKSVILGGLANAWMASKELGDLIENYCKGHDIKYINLYSPMYANKNKRKFFIPGDGHFSNEGNLFIAQLLMNQEFLD